MEQGRERIEDFIRRYWHEGNRVFRVLAVAESIHAWGMARTMVPLLREWDD